MRNTYMDDNANVPYPFQASCVLPFPMCTIRALAVCVRSQSSISSPYASNVTIHGDTVTVTLAYGNGQLLGVVEARQGLPYGTFRRSAGDLEAFGWLAVGTVLPGTDGVYTGNLPLDPQCFEQLPRNPAGRLAVNGARYSIGRTLDLRVTGFLRLSETTEVLSAEGRGTLNKGPRAYLACKVGPDLENVTDQELVDMPATYGYEMVTAINGNVIAEPGVPQWLHIAIDVPNDPDNTNKYIRTAVNGAWMLSDVTGLESDEEEEEEPVSSSGHDVLVNLDHGLGTFVAFGGSEEFPNCYGKDDDDAGEWDGSSDGGDWSGVYGHALSNELAEEEENDD